jgi:hypothetical protein
MRSRSAGLAGFVVALGACNQLAGIGDPSEAGVDAGVVESLPDAYVRPPYDPCEDNDTRCIDESHLAYCRNGAPAEQECWAGCVLRWCREVVPANDLGDLPESQASLTVPGNAIAVFDGMTGEIHRCGKPEEPFWPAEGPASDIRFVQRDNKHIWTLRELIVEKGAQVRFLAPGPVFLVVGEDAVIAGRVDVSGGRRACSLESLCGEPSTDVTCPGPGGSAGGVAGNGQGAGGGERGAQGSGLDGGGGGGGYGTPGAAGGLAAWAANGGADYGEIELQPLRGGSGGGSGGGASGGAGGGGGGALQITAGRHVQMNHGGFILAGGGGGGAGLGGDGGGGGGSGGAILIQAPSLNGGFFVAAGGGGGAGDAESDEIGAGCDGNRLELPHIPGGMGSNAGGNGAGLHVASGGEPANGVAADGSGGGGGAHGRIVVQTLIGAETNLWATPDAEVVPLFEP